MNVTRTGDELARQDKTAPYVPVARWLKRRHWLTIMIAALVVTVVVVEVRTSWVQSLIFSAAAKGMSYRVKNGSGVPLQTPGNGPYDQRLGYANLPKVVERVQERGFAVTSYTESSPSLRKAISMGIYPPYPEKSQAGLRLLDRWGDPMFVASHPERIYSDFPSIPPAIWSSLLLIENREILDPGTPFRNPAVEWDRLANAVVDYAARKVKPGHSQSGGSTLATQLEKLRHTSGGRTSSLNDKLVQMTSASMRAYHGGVNTVEARKQIVLDYVNSMPLAAVPGYGEVTGLGDGLFAWFGADFNRVNALLAKGEATPETALAYRQVLSLLLSVKKPGAYLQRDRAALDSRVTAFLPLLARRGVISEALRDLTMTTPLSYQDRAEASERALADRKSLEAVRTRLLPLLGIDSLYDLDRMDLTVTTSLDQRAGDGVAKTLRALNDPAFAAQSGLFGEHLLSSWNMPASGPKKDPIIYSFTLYERGNGVNLLRVETDNYDQPLQMNDGTRLELGSTAKLRTLITYLELVAELHANPPAAPDPADALSVWAAEYLKTATDKSLPAMLEAAMERKYSANPGEGFFTGGGLHYFQNFQKEDNGRILTVRESFHRSVNLVFVRMMRDIVNYHIYRKPGVRALLEDDGDPARQQFLARFADIEGREYMTRFWKRFAGQSPEEALQSLADQPGMTPKRLAVIFRSVRPEGPVSDLAAFLGKDVPPGDVEDYYAKYDPKKFDWNDLGYLAHIHPLELWLLRYRFAHPDANLKQALATSVNERQFVYRWLFKSNRTHAQNLRIRTLLEEGAFEEIHDRWKRVGYPFARLVPSIATSIGSSGDNPAALATLAGIIVNGGVRYPNARVERLEFATRTPMETKMELQPSKGEQVLAPEIARVVRLEMRGVVEFGTARRAFNSVKLSSGEVLPVGGKTGTGDNRIAKSQVVNRTAAFVFTIGDRYYGTVVAYVPGAQASSYSFTSALPVQVFRTLVPSLKTVLDPAAPNTREVLAALR